MPQVNEFAALVDARNFGAQGDGVNDDAPKIQAAINFLAGFGGVQGASCYLPPGRYLLLTPIVIPNGITISGAGDDTVLLLGRDTADRSIDCFTVADGLTAGFTNLTVKGPTTIGAFTVRFVNKLGTSGSIVLSSITATNVANAPVQVAVGSRFVLENCSEVAEDYYPVSGAPVTLTHDGDALWTGGNWPRRIKGTANPSAGAGVVASEGSLYQRFVAGSGQVWLKTGAADTAWTMLAAGPAGGTLQAAYDAGPPVTITLDVALGGIGIFDGPVPVVGNLFEVMDNTGASVYLGADPDGINTDFGVQMVNSTTPVSSAGAVRLRANGNQLQLSRNGGAYASIPVAGETTLQVAYDSGTAAAKQPIVLGSGGRLAVSIQNAAAPIVGNLLEVTNNAITTEYLGVSVANGVLATSTWSLKDDTISFVEVAGAFSTAFIRTAASTGSPVVALSVIGGAGLAATGLAAANGGGLVSMTGGVGGAASAAFAAANGGTVLLQGGAGGVAATPRAAGTGGLIAINGGTGGAANAAIAGGIGGAIAVTAGLGGAGTATGVSGAGGGLTIAAGDAGASGGGGLGNGGDLALLSGAGAIGGGVLIVASAGSTTTGGAVIITSGAGTTGGVVRLRTGDSSASTTGPNIIMNPGHGTVGSGTVDVLIDDTVATISDALRLRKTLAGAGAAGLGVAQVFNLDNSASTETTAGRFSLEWTVATAASETALYRFTAMQAGTVRNLLTLAHAGSTLFSRDAATNTTTDVLTLQHASSGAAAASFGSGLLFQLQDDGGTQVDAGRMRVDWTVAAAATVTSEWVWTTRSAGAALATASTVSQAKTTVPTAYAIGTAATPEWSVTVAGTAATYAVADTTYTHAFTQATAKATGAVSFFTATGAKNTNQTLSTEVSGVVFDMSAGREWATGAIATQREVRFVGPAYSFVGASTISNAATLYASQPTAGTNATLTVAVPAWFENSNANTAVATAGMLMLSSISSGVPAAGFGGQVFIKLHNDANALVDGVALRSEWTNAGAAVLTSRFTVLTRTAGAVLTSALQVDSTQVVTPGGYQAGSTLNTAGFALGSGNLLTIQQRTGGIATFRANSGSINTMAFTWSSSSTATGSPQFLHQLGGKTTQSSEALGWDWDASTSAFSVSASYATQRTHYFRAPVYTASSASVLTDAILAQWDTPAASGANITITNVSVHRLGSSAALGPSQTTTTYSGVAMSDHTLTYTNTTGSTAACGIAGIRLGRITVAQSSGAGTLTETAAASLYISNAPVAGTGTALTNTYAIFVDAGVARFDGDGTNVFEIDADTTVPGAATGRIPIKDTSTGATRYIMVSDA